MNRLIRRAVAFAVWACLGLSVAVPIQAQVWAPVSRISNTIGNNAGRVCVGGGADFVGCPSQSLYVTSGGQVGIGTNTPSATLDVHGTVSATYLQLSSPTAVLACSSTAIGAMRYTSGTMQVCDGSNWGNIGIGVPTGTIAAFAAASCPNGWSEYTPARGRFLRGIDNGAGNDPDGTRAAGSTQGDAIGNHKHEIAGRSISNKASGASTIYYIYDHGGDPGSWSHNSYYTTSDPSTGNTATETRSKNVAVTFCVYSGFQSAPGQTILTTLASLTDVSIAGATTGQVLAYDGASWVPSDTTAGSGALGDRITSGTVSVTVNTDGFISLTTGVTDWGYLSSGNSYLPTLIAGRVSSTNISATYLQLSSPTTILACNAGFTGALRYKSGELQLCNGTVWTATTAATPIFTTCTNENSDGDGTDDKSACVEAAAGTGSGTSNYRALNCVGTGGGVRHGRVIQWSGTKWQWYHEGSSSLQDCTDGETLVANLNAVSGGSGGSGTLDALTDVNTSGAATGSILAYNGSSWVISSTGNSTALGDRITSGTVSVTVNTDGYVSLTTGVTDWGYLSSGNSYLPTLIAGRVSSTNISGSLIQVGSGNSASCNASLKGAIRYSNTSSTLELCNGVDWGGIYTGGGSDLVAFVADQKSSGTDGGSYTAGSWVTRDLNTELFDNIGVTVASNQITLPAGTYDFDISVPAYRLDQTQTRLYNVTDGTVALFGMNGYARDDYAGHTFSAIKGRVTIGATKTFAVQLRAQGSRATNGLGVMSGFGTETYTFVGIRKINSGGGGGGGASQLSDLTDVNTSGATAGSVIRYDGANWVVSTSGDSSALGDRITSGTVSVTTNANGYISLTTGVTDWGYLSSGNSYLPTLVASRISSTNISGTLIQVGQSAATCSSGISGSIRYNTTSNTVQFCNGTGWASLASGTTGGASALSGLTDVQLTNLAARDHLRYDSVSSKWVNISESTVMSTTTMIPDWPDAIICNVTNPSWGPTAFYPAIMPYTGGDSLYHYRANIQSGAIYAVRYNSSGAFASYAGITTTDCNTSISSLYSSGKAFNFIGNAATGGGALGDRITSGTVSVTVNTNGYISLTSGVTDWGYLSSGNSYLPSFRSTNISASSAIQVGSNSLTCVSGISGSIRYSQISSTMEYCNSTAWVSMGPSGTQPISFKATNGSAQSFSANTTTKLNFATEEFDTNNNFASSRFTATVPGKYLFTASVLLTGVTGGADIYIFKNGTYSGIGSAINGNVTKSGLSASGVLDLAVNDYVEVYGWVGSGSPVHYQSYNQFSGVLLSPQDSGGGGAGTLNDLSDVDTSGAATGSIIAYNGANWVVSSTASSSALGDRITSGTVSVTVNTNGYISLTTGVTEWGYLSSGNSYLPTLVASRVSATNVSATAIHAAGNVGIGTSVPSTSLYVNGGQIAGGFGAMSTSGVLDFNDASNARSGNGYTLLRGSTASNAPNTSTNYWQTLNFEYGASKLGDGNITQLAIPYSAGASISEGMYMRGRYSGTWSGWYKFIVSDPSGSAVVANNLTAAAFLYSSDKRLKENIIPLTGGLTKLDAITPVSFRFISDTTHTERLGVIAQEVEKVYPQAVINGSDGFKKVDYPALVPVLIQAVKELRADNRGLQAANDNLRKDVDAYRETQRASLVDTVGLKEKVKVLEAANDNLVKRLEALEARKASMK